MQKTSQLRIAKIINLLGAILELLKVDLSLFFYDLGNFLPKLTFTLAVPSFSILLHNYLCRQAAGGMTAMRMPELVLS